MLKEVILSLFICNMSFSAFGKNSDIKLMNTGLEEKNIEKKSVEMEDANDRNAEVKNKLKYSYKPSSLYVGVDVFRLFFNLFKDKISCSEDNKNYNLDFRIRIGTDFNFILPNITFGILRKETTNSKSVDPKTYVMRNKTVAILFNFNCNFNLINKNSGRDAIYIGGGINFNKTNYREYNISKNKNNFYDIQEKGSSWLWFNIDFGCKKKILKFLHLGWELSYKFLKIELKNCGDSNGRSNTQGVDLYGYGGNGFNRFFSFYAILNFDLFNDEKVLKKESVLNYN